MSNQTFLEEEVDTLMHVQGAQEWVSKNLLPQSSPFIPVTFTTRLLRVVLQKIIALIERSTGETLYVENKLLELATINTPALRLVSKLIKDEIVTSWKFVKRVPDAPYVAQCTLTLGKVTLPSGTIKSIQGAVCSGLGATLNEAILPALGEVLERHALCTWSEKDLVVGTQSEVRRAVPVKYFWCYGELELSNLKEVDSAAEPIFRWVSATTLSEGQKVNIPAQTVYLNFLVDYKDEPNLGSSTTNGAAAATTFRDASVRGINELVERDAFLLHWLHKHVPIRLDLSTVQDSALGKIINELEQWGIEICVLDITTDLGVPTLCAVLHDPSSQNPISVGAATGFDIKLVLHKVLYDMVRWTHNRSPINKHSSEIHRPITEIKNMEDRRFYWQVKGGWDEISWLTSGANTTLGDLINKYRVASRCQTRESQFEYYQKVFKEKQYECYLVDVTSAQAKSSGLRIVKAVAPDLIPIYFNESRKPLGIKRLYNAPLLLKWHQEQQTSSELNLIPHPFI